MLRRKLNQLISILLFPSYLQKNSSDLSFNIMGINSVQNSIKKVVSPAALNLKS